MRTEGAPLTRVATAGSGSSEAARVDRHETTYAGLRGGAVGGAVVGKRTAVEHGNGVIYKALTCRISPNVSCFHLFRSDSLLFPGQSFEKARFLFRILDVVFFSHSQLVGGVVGVRSLRTQIPFRTHWRLSGLRPTVRAGSAEHLGDCTWIMSKNSLLGKNLINVFREEGIY